MRIFVSIFSFYLLFLTIYPAFAARVANTKTICSQKNCCPDAIQGKQPDDSKKCPNGTRTPLFRCPYIQIAIHQVDEICFNELTVIGKTFSSSYKESSFVAFLFPPWHPPKV